MEKNNLIRRIEKLEKENKLNVKIMVIIMITIAILEATIYLTT